MLGRLKEKGVQILTETKAVEIREGSVILEGKQGARFTIEADSVVVAIGSVSETSLLEELKGKEQEIYAVGEAAQVGNVGSGLRSTAKVALGNLI